MFDFDEIENKKIKQLENRIFELDNQIKYWKSMYEKEVKKRPVITRYDNDSNSSKRLVKILKLHHDSKDMRYKNMLIESLYMDYGITNEPTDDLFEYWMTNDE